MPGRQKPKEILPSANDDYEYSEPVENFFRGVHASTAAVNAPVPTIVERTSADGRRIYTETLSVDPPSPIKCMRMQPVPEDFNRIDIEDPPLLPLPTFDFAFDAELESERYDMDLRAIFDRPVLPVRAQRGKKKGKITPSDKCMHEWRLLRDEYLQAIIRLEGPGDADEARWDGEMFHPTTLTAQGMVVQLCHAGCVAPVRVKKFILLDIGCIHILTVDFCGCERRHGTKQRTDVLQKRWYPATHDTPRTAATFNFLDFFLIQTHQAKTTMYDFYMATVRSTNGTGIKLPNRYPELLRMVRQWRHIKLLKWAGRAHDPSGVNGMRSGALAIECPACPHPAVNLAPGWENAPPEDKFLYYLFLALDACFRLKRRMASSELRDPGLGTGWAYFVEQEPYQKYLLLVTNETEMSTCSGLAALDYANTKFSRGYTTTGVGMGVCARHEFVQPTGISDLQKGERYSNMNWIFSAIMCKKDPRLFKVVSYDIICQWFKKLFERLLKMPSAVRFVIVMSLMRFVIPKMHIHSHTLACQLLFSLNFLLGAGQTDGEGIERPWANLGGVATSTREMGPGSRCNTLDSHLSYWNWSKLIGIADLLCRRLDKARAEEREQTEAFESFTAEQGECTAVWRTMVHAFEADPKKPNPYEMKSRGFTEADVRLRLAESDTASMTPSLHDVSPTGFIYAGLDLEEQQKLTQGINRFRKLQATYTPGALQALARLEENTTETSETMPLMLPSALSDVERNVGCVGGVQIVEAEARDAQCDASLLRLRHQLHIKSRFLTYKRNHSHHQGANTRSRTLVARNECKIRLHSEKYQAAWNAIRWLDICLMQDAEDLQKREERRKKEAARRRRLAEEGEAVEMGDDDDDEGWVDEDEGADAAGGSTESRRTVSWIWTVAGTRGSDAELEEALHIEWAKAYTRSRRWKEEEVRLLEEEFRRIVVSFEYEEERWLARARLIPIGEVEEGFAQGAIAYALQQAAM
ncbi:hypothetical protein B0H16DRAFT_1745484 [Mycena metata]|uniref:CxC2-like cysteine cluster KDZ transposase-associated domain-containing protein n=1 Tax=Mycena metata TaxID=1033252 RepID=A0AAD7H3M5_9AGAR|nr:hypothetical protein B0H16DRAFT_1745484 [Mycena metata]